MFDLDGTVADTVALIIASYDHALNKVVGHRPDPRLVRTWIGKTLAVTRGTIQDDVLQQVAPPTLKIQRFDDDNATVAAFISGQTQLLATGAAVAAAAIQKNPQVQAEYKLLLKDSPNFIGVRKGETALLNKVNEIIRAARADGTLEKVAQKYLGRGTGTLPD